MPSIPKHASWHLMSGIAKNNWSKKQKYKLLRLGLAEEGREARGTDVILAEFIKGAVSSRF